MTIDHELATLIVFGLVAVVWFACNRADAREHRRREEKRLREMRAWINKRYSNDEQR